MQHNGNNCDISNMALRGILLVYDTFFYKKSLQFILSHGTSITSQNCLYSMRLHQHTIKNSFHASFKNYYSFTQVITVQFLYQLNYD